MRRRRLFWISAAVLALVSIGAIAWPRADRVTRENWERIRRYMPRAEVESILGPPGDYRSGPGETGVFFRDRKELPCELHWTLDADHDWDSAGIRNILDRGIPASQEDTLAIWVGDAGEVEIYFFPDGVQQISFNPRRKVDQRPLDQLRWRLGRQWRMWFPR